MLIWGWKTYVTRMAVLFAVCAHCQHEGAQVIDVWRRKFTLFFIPTFTTSTTYVQQCTFCAAKSQVTPGYAEWAVGQAAGASPSTHVASQAPSPSRGQDALIRLAVAPEELAGGAIRPVTLDTGVRCDQCEGQGGSGQTRCATCEGHGRVRATRTLQARIPAGTTYGSRLRLAEEGEVGPQGGPPGDVYIELVQLQDAPGR